MFRLFVIVCLMIIATASCTDKREVLLTRDDLRLADSLFLVSRNEWNARLKDSCDMIREEKLSMWTDSIKDRRLSEIKLMLDQYEKSK